MKKITIIGSIILALIIAAVVSILLLIGGGETEVEGNLADTEASTEADSTTFKLSDYESYVEQYSSNRMLGAVDTKEVAIEKAEELWRKVYGDYSAERKPYAVYYDAENEVWLVEGTLPSGTLGGVPHLIVSKVDGKILALWHDR
ncbi:MAG: hypothetical protein IJ499_06780 [Clostridia bacterium]|nr:hypothetical protein [Clostridia bacterium]